jgi:hypothetical protein
MRCAAEEGGSAAQPAGHLQVGAGACVGGWVGWWVVRGVEGSFESGAETHQSSSSQETGCTADGCRADGCRADGCGRGWWGAASHMFQLGWM